MIPKEQMLGLSVNILMGEIEELIQGIKFPMKLSVKEMKPIHLGEFGYHPLKRYAYGEDASGLDLSTFNNFILKEAELAKKLENEDTSAKEGERLVCEAIEKFLRMLPAELIRIDDGLSPYNVISHDVFSLREIALLIKRVFAYIYNEGDYFIVVKSRQNLRFRDGDVKTVKYVNMGGESSTANKRDSFLVSIGEKTYPINLKKCLQLCRRSILYRDVDVIPHSPLESPSIDDTFNLYGSYVHKYDPNFAIDNELVSLWTDHIREILAAGNKEVGEYLLNWFAHLLQKPQIKTQTVPLIKGEPGCGKNTPINVFSRYVLNPSMAIVCPDMEKLFPRFNAARVGKSLIVLDEAVDSRNRALNNKMKNFITEERVQIEAKGKDIIEASDFSNYFIITNNDFASIIEKGDRRYICLEASSIRKGNRAYFKTFNKRLANVEAGCHLFHWLLQRDISNFDTDDLPKTSYKKELSARQTDSVVKWLLDKYELLRDNGAEDVEEFMLSPAWYQQYVAWCKEVGGESKIHSLSVFNGIMNKEDFKTREMKVPRADGSRTSIKPRFVSRAILEANLSDYIVISDDE